jgi:hypothetical protein
LGPVPGAFRWPQVTWFERQVRRLDRFQQRHVVIAFPWAVVQKSFTSEADEDPL